MKIVYITFFCFAPIAICLLQFLLVHFIYDFSGVFLGGLGLAIVSAFAVILCIGALGVSFIAVCIKKYLAKKGKTIDKDRFTVIKDIINIIGVIALVIAGVIYISIYSVEFVKEKKYEKLVEEKQAFMKEMDLKTPNGGVDLKNEAKVYCFSVEEMVNNPDYKKEIMEDDDPGRALYTNASKKALINGMENFIEFSEDYAKTTDFYDYDNIFYDKDERLVYVGIEYGASDTKTHAGQNCYMVVVYDEKLNVKDIYCETYEDYFREHRY